MADHVRVPEPRVPDERRCRRGARCGLRELDSETGGWLGAPLEAPGLCPPDEHRLDQALTELPELWAELRRLVRPSAAAAADVVSSAPPGSSLPLRAAPLVLAERIRDELLGWETLVRARMGMRRPQTPADPRDLDPADRGQFLQAWAVGRAARVLHDAMPTLLALEPRPLRRWNDAGTARVVEHLDGVDAACLIIAMYYRAIATAGRGRLVHHLPMPCPRCEHWTLQRDNGQDHARCTTCGGRWDEQRYAFLGRMLLQDLDDAARCADCDERGVLPDDTLCPHPALLTGAQG